MDLNFKFRLALHFCALKMSHTYMHCYAFLSDETFLT